MKRTTYIFIGLLVSGLVVIVTSIIAMTLMGEKRVRSEVFLDGEQVEMNLDGVHVLKMLIDQGDVELHRRIFMSGDMMVTNTSIQGRESISYPKNQRLNVTQNGDTLVMIFDFKADTLSKERRYHDWLFVSGFNARLNVNKLTTIMSSVEGVRLNLKDVETDSLFIRTNQQTILLDSCQLRSLDLAGNGITFHAKKSKIENFYLLLDGMRNWNFEDSEVGTEYLTGTGRQSCSLQKGECRRVIWNPYNKDAQLQMTILEKAEIIVIPE